MPRCDCAGWLVDSSQPLPTDSSEHDVPYLPRIGCSRVKCWACGAMVRNAPGLAFNTKDDVTTATLATIYDLPDLLQSELIHRTHDKWRLYLCRCSRFLAVREAPLDTGDPDDSPNKPWRCDDHPVGRLPTEVGGERIASEHELRDQTRRGLHGYVPPATRETDRDRRADWLLRLHSRLEPDLATAMAEVATETIEDPDAAARSASLRFLFFAGTDQMRERVFAMLTTKPELLAAAIDIGITPLDKTLAEMAWHVVGPLVAADGPVRSHARAEALGGRATRALYIVLAEYDGDWLVTKLEEVAYAAPGNASDLTGSLFFLPKDKKSGDHTDRVRSALIRADEPVDEILKLVKELVSAFRRKPSAAGAMEPLKVSLPRLQDNTALELEITGVGTDYTLTLRVARVDGTSVARELRRGSKSHLLTFLNDNDVADRILFQSVEARR